MQTAERFRWPAEYDIDVYVLDDQGDAVEEEWSGAAEISYQHALSLLERYDEQDIRIQVYRFVDGQTDTTSWTDITLDQLAEKAKEEVL